MEREAEQKRIVVETPNTRREEVYSQATRYPEDRRGVSGAALAAIVVGVVALAAIIILFVMNQRQNAVNDNATAQQQPQTIIQQPAQQQPPVIVQQPAAPAAQPPVIINGQPAAAPAAAGSTSTGPDDSTVQAAVDKKLSDDPALSALGITVTVMNGKATLLGAVHNTAEKNQVERAVRSVKGVKSIDNQITVSGE
jgi:ABC-type lipoprotein release transport system permease subunit